jgi:transcription initiation factor TFIIIB Brf1 subunit/transcription initiation factor TFIIB
MSHPRAKHRANSDLSLAVYCAVTPARVHTLDEIANIMGVTRERVRQIEADAIRKLRKKMSKIVKHDEIEEADIISCLMNCEG